MNNSHRRVVYCNVEFIVCFRYKTRYSPNLKAALGASDRIQRRVEELVKRKDYSLDSDNDLSDESLEVLRDSLREERKVLSEAIREADREYVFFTMICYQIKYDRQSFKLFSHSRSPFASLISLFI